MKRFGTLAGVGAVIAGWALQSGCPVSSCVARGTWISTPGGRRRVEELRVGDEVISVDPETGEACVQKLVAIAAAVRETILVEAGDDSFVGTSDHPVWCAQRRDWIAAGNFALDGGTGVLTAWRDGSLEAIDVRASRMFAGMSDVYDLTVAAEPRTFVANGVLVHNKSPIEDCVSEEGLWCECEDFTDGQITCWGDCWCPGTFTDAGSSVGDTCPQGGRLCACPGTATGRTDCGGVCQCSATADAGTDAGAPTPAGIIHAPFPSPWFFYEDESVYYLCGAGGHAGFLYRGDRLEDGTVQGDQEAMIRRAANGRMTGIEMTVIRSHGGSGDDLQNPFVDGEPGSGLNEAVMAQWREWLRYADARRVVSYVTLYDEGASVFSDADNVDAREESLVREIVRSLSDARGLVWVVSRNHGPAMSSQRALDLAEIIGDEDSEHPVVVGMSGADFAALADTPWPHGVRLEVGGSTPDEVHGVAATMVSQAAGVTNVTLAGALSAPDEAEARQKLWAAAMAGAYVVPSLDLNGATEPLKTCGNLSVYMREVLSTGMRPNDAMMQGLEWGLTDPAEGRFVGYGRAVGAEAGFLEMNAGLYELAWLDVVSDELVYDVQRAVDGANVFGKPEHFGSEVALAAKQIE